MHDDICLAYCAAYFAMYTNIESLYCKPETNTQSAFCIHRICIYGFNQLMTENSFLNRKTERKKKQNKTESSKKAKLEFAVHRAPQVAQW